VGPGVLWAALYHPVCWSMNYPDPWSYPMSKTVLLMFCLLCGLLLLACAKPDATTNREATNSSSSTATASPSAATNTTASADQVGIPECDAFITKYDECVSSKVPESLRPQFKSNIAQWRTAWKQAAANPQTRATLVATCQTTIETARTSMKSFGCTF
jgi:hypothetical protein